MILSFFFLVLFRIFVILRGFILNFIGELSLFWVFLVFFMIRIFFVFLLRRNL